MKLRIGFIGLGAMGLSHVQSIRRLCSDQAEIAALSDMTEANLQQALQIAPSAKVLRLRRNSSARRSTRSSFPRRTSRMQILFPASWRPESICFWKSRRHFPRRMPACAGSVQSEQPSAHAGTRIALLALLSTNQGTGGQGRNWVPHMVWTREFQGLFKEGGQLDPGRSKVGRVPGGQKLSSFRSDELVGGSTAQTRGVPFGGCAVNRVIEGFRGP